MLIVVLAVAVLAVGAIAAVTATVIVKDDGGGTRRAMVSPGPAPGQVAPPLGPQGMAPAPGVLPRLPGLGNLRGCLQQNGLGAPGSQGGLPRLQKLRDALKACRNALPGLAPSGSLPGLAPSG